MVELGIPELTTEQIETLSSIAENAARKYVLSKVSKKDIDRLDISVEADGAKPVNVTVEVNLDLLPQAKNHDPQAIVKDAVDEAHKAAENFLRNIK
jgi:hypothetical protein